jgi:type VI secretion system protein VasG
LEKWIDDNHNAKIISMCNDPDSGGRMVDNIVTNTLLPALS